MIAPTLPLTKAELSFEAAEQADEVADVAPAVCDVKTVFVVCNGTISMPTFVANASLQHDAAPGGARRQVAIEHHVTSTGEYVLLLDLVHTVQFTQPIKFGSPAVHYSAPHTNSPEPAPSL